MCDECSAEKQAMQQIALREAVRDVRRAMRFWISGQRRVVTFLLARMTGNSEFCGAMLAALAHDVAVLGWLTVPTPMILKTEECKEFTEEAMVLVRQLIAGQQIAGAVVLDMTPVTEQGGDHAEDVAIELFRLLLLASEHRARVVKP